MTGSTLQPMRRSDLTGPDATPRRAVPRSAHTISAMDHAGVRSIRVGRARHGQMIVVTVHTLHGWVARHAIVEAWAGSVAPLEVAPRLDPYVGAVKGIGIALFCYMRMRAGADAIKPDARVRQALQGLGFDLPAGEATLLVVASTLAQEVGISRLILDQLLWWAGNAPPGGRRDAVTADHSMIRPTLLAMPNRSRVIAAKVVASVIAGAALGLVAEAIAIGVGAAGLAARGIQTGLSAGDFAQLLLGGAAAAALWAAIGVGVGASVAIRSERPSA